MFDFFFFFFGGVGCDYGLCLKWRWFGSCGCHGFGGCGCVGWWVFFFFPLLRTMVEVVTGGVVVEVVVAGWKVFVVDIFYFILMNFLYYFNQMERNIDPLILGVL